MSKSSSENSAARPLVGISLEALEAVVTQAGGRAALQSKTTGWLKENFVLPSTREAACSAADWLITHGFVDKRDCGRANAFVSHAYDYEFLKVVDAVRAWEHRQSASSCRFFYYFDLLVVNQHAQTSVVPFEVLRDEFGGSVRGIGRTLLFLDWHEPIALKVRYTVSAVVPVTTADFPAQHFMSYSVRPSMSRAFTSCILLSAQTTELVLQRAWCVFEVATTLEVSAEFAVIMAPADEATFEATLVDNFDSLVTKTCTIDAEAAKAREPADLSNIQAVIRNRPGGFLAVNQLLVGAMKDWMAATAARALDRIEDAEERASCKLATGLADLLFDQGNSDAAEPLLRAALEARSRLLGASDARTLACMDRLGLCLQSRDQVTEAEKLFRQVLEGMTAVLGKDDLSTFCAMNNLGRALHDLRRLDEAEPLLKASLEGKRAVLGDGDPSTLDTMSNYALLLIDKGDLVQAEALMREVLRGNRATLGDTHPATLVSVNNLARIFLGRGLLDQAAEMFAEALALRRRTLGDTHPRTLTTMSNLASTLQDLGRLSEACALQREAYEAKLALMGGEHSSTLISKNNLARCLIDMGERDEGMALASEMVPVMRRVLSPADPILCAGVNTLGRALLAHGRAEEACDCFREALERRRVVLGPTHEVTLVTLVNLAKAMEARGMLADAESQFADAFKGLRATCGDKYFETRACAAAFASLLRKLGKGDEAAEVERVCA